MDNDALVFALPAQLSFSVESDISLDFVLLRKLHALRFLCLPIFSTNTAAVTAKNLDLEPRARIIPEERLEASLLPGDEAAVEKLLQDEESGIAVKRVEISRMVQGSFSLESIKLEVSKCRVLCSNHHQKHTIQQFWL